MKLVNDLEDVLNTLRNIDEENFDYQFTTIKNKMILAQAEVQELEKLGFFEQNQTIKEKIKGITKLISEEYDNKISLWKDKLDEISELLISSRNEKKILSYKR